MKFSTKDQGNDETKGGYHCAKYLNAGWWYRACHATNLNGLYGGSAMINAMYNTWSGWTRYHEALKTSIMMIRPKKILKNEYLVDAEIC